MFKGNSPSFIDFTKYSRVPKSFVDCTNFAIKSTIAEKRMYIVRELVPNSPTPSPLTPHPQNTTTDLFLFTVIYTFVIQRWRLELN